MINQPKKIVVVGPESTGKSTLSEELAAALGCPWVPEYAREYLEGLGRPYDEPDLLQIAKGQVAQEERLSSAGSPCLVCDTDLYVIKVWSEHKYGRCDPWIIEQISLRKYDLYLLTDIDIAWQHDPLREHPEQEMRQYFFDIYKKIVVNSRRPSATMRGRPAERLAAAIEAVRKFL